MTDCVRLADLVADALSAAEKKARLPVRDMLVGGFMSGALLAFAALLSFTVTAQGLPPIAGALLFPSGFAVLVLLEHELATGNLALLPMGVAAGRATFGHLLRNWC